MSTVDYSVIVRRLTDDRLRSYLDATGGNLEAGMRLYDWNIRMGSAVHEDLARVEVVFRNAL